jgi:hypothetical protein
MKRIALTVLALALSGGVAFAATPTTPASTPAQHHHHMMHKTAMSGSHEAQRMTSALNLLEAKGYGSFNNFKRDGKDFTATVTKNGQSQMLRIDPDSGQVTSPG